jgi:nucleoside-diphosphate-sugar epimerase
MNILVTGAAGYIGSNLIHFLMKKSNYVVYAVSRDKLHVSDKQLHHVVCDLTEFDFINKLPPKIDTVIHFAQSNEYRNFPDGASDMFAVNVRSTQLLLEWGRRNKISKFIFSSTGNVYKPQNKLLIESDACQPNGYYGASKFVAEQLIQPYSQFFETKILRLFGVYGPGQKGMVVANIIEKLRSGEAVTLAQGIGLKFTPLYIDDCVKMIEETIRIKTDANIYNFAGNKVIRLGDIAELIAQNLKINLEILTNQNNPTYLMGSIDKFLNDYEYVPTIDLEIGIKRTLNI